MAEWLRRRITNPVGLPAWVQFSLASHFCFIAKNKSKERAGFEPATTRSAGECSTTELTLPIVVLFSPFQKKTSWREQCLTLQFAFQIIRCSIVAQYTCLSRRWPGFDSRHRSFLFDRKWMKASFSKKKEAPLPGIEPGSAGWKPAILAN